MTTDEHEEIVIDDEDVADVPALPQAKDGETIDWEAEAKKFQGMATRRGTKLAKVKSAKPAKPAEVTPAAPDTKKGELDYGQKAFLISNGLKDAEDHKYVQEMMVSSGKSLEEVLAIPFVSAELKRLGEERVTKAAAPAANEGRQGAPARDTVEYYLAKGEMPPADQPKLRQEYVNEKIKREKTAGQFSSTPVVH